MNSYNAIKEAALNKKISISSIGRAMGKPDNYVSNGASRGSNPQADTLAAMLEVCGYKLAAIPAEDLPDTALVIDPPSKEK